MVREAPRPWEEAYRRQGRLWRGSRLDNLTLAFLAERPEAAEERWLDAGCGDGKGLAPLSAHIAPDRLFGGDRSAWGLRLAREQAARVQGHLLRADARAWPFPDASFMVVRAVHLFGHLLPSAMVAALRDSARILMPGGALLVAEFGTGDFRCGRGEEVAPRTYRRGHGILTHYFEEEELRELLRSVGLAVNRCTAERFTVRYGSVDRPRERWGLVARKPQPTV